MSDICARCGLDGADRRTLWMACFYDMSELGIQFDREVLFRAKLEDLTSAKEPTYIDLPNGPSITIGGGTYRTTGELSPRDFYTLRVCKRCRGDWMGAIEQWFRAAPLGMDHDAADGEVQPDASVGSGIFIRENGSIREVSEEEFERIKQLRAK